MNYAEMLDKIISESELSLRQISKLCTQFDITITPSYISQLKNGKLPPPSPEVSLALAKVCNSKNQSQLVFQGYMEKAPDVIKEYMLASSQLNRIMLESLYKADNSSISQEALDYLKNLDVLSTLEMSSKYISQGGSIDPSELVREITLSSGGVSKVQAQGDMINFFLGDTSMNPSIPVHSYIYILPTKLELLKEKDVIAILYPNNRKQATLRRIFFSNDKILLIPEDKSFQIYIIESFEDIDYIGKVVSYKVDL